MRLAGHTPRHWPVRSRPCDCRTFRPALHCVAWEAFAKFPSHAPLSYANAFSCKVWPSERVGMHVYFSCCLWLMASTWSCCIVGINTFSTYIWGGSFDTSREKATRLHNSFVCSMPPVAGCACLCCCSCTKQTDVMLSVTSLAGGAGWRDLVCLGPTLSFQPRMLILLFVSSHVSSTHVAARYLFVFVVHVPQLLNTVFNTHPPARPPTHPHTRAPTHPPTNTCARTHTHPRTYTHTNTDRQTDRQTDGRTDRQTYLHYSTFHYIAAHYITSHYITHYTTLTTPHYITYIYTQPFAFAIHQSQTIPFHDGLCRHIHTYTHTHIQTYRHTCNSLTRTSFIRTFHHLMSLSCLSHSGFTFLLWLMGRSWHVGLSGHLFLFYKHHWSTKHDRDSHL